MVETLKMGNSNLSCRKLLKKKAKYIEGPPNLLKSLEQEALCEGTRGVVPLTLGTGFGSFLLLSNQGTIMSISEPNILKICTVKMKKSSWNSVQFNEASQLLLVVSASGTICVLDQDKKVKTKWKSEEEARISRAIWFSHHEFIVGFSNGSMETYHLSKTKAQQRITGESTAGISDILVVQEELSVIVGGFDGLVYRASISNGQTAWRKQMEVIWPNTPTNIVLDMKKRAVFGCFKGENDSMVSMIDYQTGQVYWSIQVGLGIKGVVHTMLMLNDHFLVSSASEIVLFELNFRKKITKEISRLKNEEINKGDFIVGVNLSLEKDKIVFGTLKGKIYQVKIQENKNSF